MSGSTAHRCAPSVPYRARGTSPSCSERGGIRETQQAPARTPLRGLLPRPVRCAGRRWEGRGLLPAGALDPSRHPQEPTGASGPPEFALPPGFSYPERRLSTENMTNYVPRVLPFQTIPAGSGRASLGKQMPSVTKNGRQKVPSPGRAGTPGLAGPAGRRVRGRAPEPSQASSRRQPVPTRSCCRDQGAS